MPPAARRPARAAGRAADSRRPAVPRVLFLGGAGALLIAVLSYIAHWYPPAHRDVETPADSLEYDDGDALLAWAAETEGFVVNVEVADFPEGRGLAAKKAIHPGEVLLFIPDERVRVCVCLSVYVCMCVCVCVALLTRLRIPSSHN